jgi:D-arabinose 1-dehydrogenase-like Zn-dependent alcohol dehydrogenase
MVDKGRAAIYTHLGQPMRIVEYPVPQPEPGAILVKLTRANVCGPDLHIRRGDMDRAFDDQNRGIVSRATIRL